MDFLEEYSLSAFTSSALMARQSEGFWSSTVPVARNNSALGRPSNIATASPFLSTNSGFLSLVFWQLASLTARMSRRCLNGHGRTYFYCSAHDELKLACFSLSLTFSLSLSLTNGPSSATTSGSSSPIEPVGSQRSTLPFHVKVQDCGILSASPLEKGCNGQQRKTLGGVQVGGMCENDCHCFPKRLLVEHIWMQISRVSLLFAFLAPCRQL